MMSIEIIQAAAEVATFVVRAAGDDGDAPVWLLAAGPAGAAVTYGAIWRYYRNADKTHEFERDTIIAAQPIQGGEAKVDHISRTRESKISGGNGSDFRKRVQRIR